jgi:membrane-associated phospholipid phosphatase
VSRLPASGDKSPVEAAADRRWWIAPWVVVVAFGVVTAVWSNHVGVPLRDPGGKMFSGRLTSAVILLAVLALVDANLRTGLRGWTVRRVVTKLRERWLTERLPLAIAGLVAYHLVYVCYRNLKSWDAFNQVHDADLNRFEEWLFFGNTPASLLQDLLGQQVAAPVLAAVYISFTYLVPLSLVSALVFVDRIRDGYVFLMSAIWIWVLGTASYYLIPSLGPFASAPHDFDQLPHTGITDRQAEYLTEREHLLQNPGAGDAFASISAFASLHVAFTCMVVLMLHYYGLRRSAIVLTVYLAVTMVATVYFGWHFVIDVPAGVALAFLAVFLGRVMIYPKGRPQRSG